MEKDLVRKVVQNYPASTREEAEKIHALKKTYPFSQLLHVLSARTSKEHGLEHEQNDLQLAAVHSADRGILKTMMSADREELDAAAREEFEAAQESPAVKRANVVTTGASLQEPDDLADTVIKDVNILYKTRNDFEVMFRGAARVAENPWTPSDEDRAKSKRERIIELSKALNASQTNTTMGEEPKPQRKRRERKDLIDEIVMTKTQIDPTDEKQKEQLETIDHFIKAQPSISNAKDKPLNVPDGDLSTIKTGEFTDNIVSETLVELLLKQGKKDKAVEVLKKLIWKFPQKKSYFAAQIEELKK